MLTSLFKLGTAIVGKENEMREGWYDIAREGDSGLNLRPDSGTRI